jgi:oligoendopeptidase F
MGHAFHTELSKPQGPIYSSYSFSLAETASTFFESLAFEEIVESLPEKQRVIALHNQIDDDISTIFRQVACFNFENDIHNIVRKNGYISKEELADLHNKNMKAYLGPVFKMNHDDGYSFVQWWHIRQFFYVYSYAYGQLVSKALLRRYKKDKGFIKSIEKFLSAGGKDTPENILKEIGIDVTSGQLFQEGIDQIAEDIKRLERLIK